MKRLLLLSLLLAGAGEAAEPPRAGGTIVVTGRSLGQTERALAECLARKCPPDEDIDATLAHAENLFVAGDYKAARHATLASIGRNRDQAKTYPVPLADLYRANGRIAAHLGEGHSYESSIVAIKRSLKAGLPESDIRLVAAQLEKADMYAALGRTGRARQIYADVQSESRRLGREDIAAQARLRSAWLHQLEGNGEFARAALREIAADRTPAARVTRAAALVLLARLDRQRGRPVSTEALGAELGEVDGRQPVLLFSPRIELPTNAAISHVGGQLVAGSAIRRMPMERFEKQWVDVGFWISPEGKVSDVEMLRSEGRAHWAAAVLRAVAGRIYSPVSGSEGHYRVERYSLTSLWEYDAPATHLRRRSPQARIEMLDLSVDPNPRSP